MKNEIEILEVSDRWAWAVHMAGELLHASPTTHSNADDAEDEAVAYVRGHHRGIAFRIVRRHRIAGYPLPTANLPPR